MEKSKKVRPEEQNVDDSGVNWPVVLPILIVMAVIILYVVLY